MPRNGTGTYVLPAGQPVVPATSISSSVFNTFTGDIATALTNSVSTDGQTPMAANLQMGNFKLTGLAAGVNPTDSVRYDQMTASVAGKVNTADLAADNGASLVGTKQSGAGSVARTQLAKNQDSTTFFDYFSTAQIADCIARTSTLDLYAACQAAIDAVNGPIFMIPGLYRLSAQLVVRNNCTGIIGSDMYFCTFDKRFNGDAVSSTKDGAIHYGYGIAGNGATYTGSGLQPQGYNTMMECLRIDDTADSPIKFNAAIGTNNGSGTYSSVRDCFLRPTNAATTYAIRSVGDDDSIRPTCRSFEKLSGGSSLVDFSGMNFCSLSDSLGTTVKFSANSGKVHMTGCRITASASINVLGVDHIIDENTWGFPAGQTVTIDATASNVTWGSQNSLVINGSFGQSPTLGTALGAANPNFIHSNLTAFTFGWYGSGGNPTLGNASTFAYYKLSGQECYATIGLVVGSTTVAGSGNYSFQLPFKAFVTSMGSALVKSSTGAFYEATFIVQGGSDKGIIYLFDAVTVQFGSASIAFGTNGTLNITLNYLVAPT